MDKRLYEAAISGDKGKLLALLEEDALILDRVTREGASKVNPLHLGALYGHVEFVKEISSRKPEFACKLNSQGLSPLHLASERGHVEVVKVLLEKDDSVCFVHDREGRTPLHLAAIKGRVEVVEELVRANKTTAWFPTDAGEPILHLCANHDQFETLKKLVELVNDDKFVTLKDKDDNTIIDLLSVKRSSELIEFLRNNTNIELEINAVNVSKSTAVDFAEQTRRELGHRRVKRFCHKKATKRAKWSSLVHSAACQRWGSKRDINWLNKMKSSLMVVAVLIATVTFDAVRNPPGGLWQEDYTPPTGTNSTEHMVPLLRDISDKTRDKKHFAGEAIFSNTQTAVYYLYSLFNQIGFLASTGTILIIVSGFRLERSYLVWILMVLIWISIFSMWVTYGVALYGVTAELRMGVLPSYIYALLAFLLIYTACLMGPLIVAHLLWLLVRRSRSSILQKKKKKGEEEETDVIIEVPTDKNS